MKCSICKEEMSEEDIEWCRLTGQDFCHECHLKKMDKVEKEIDMDTEKVKQSLKEIDLWVEELDD